ncbi:MAG: hypothetical protein V8S27_00870 [Lachnospiraceae bacterium]
MEDMKERYGRQVSADDGCDTDGAWNFALDSESSENGDGTEFWRAITMLGNAGWFWIFLTLVLILNKRTKTEGIASALSLLSLAFL